MSRLGWGLTAPSFTDRPFPAPLPPWTGPGSSGGKAACEEGGARGGGAAASRGVRDQCHYASVARAAIQGARWSGLAAPLVPCAVLFAPDSGPCGAAARGGGGGRRVGRPRVAGERPRQGGSSRSVTGKPLRHACLAVCPSATFPAQWLRPACRGTAVMLSRAPAAQSPLRAVWRQLVRVANASATGPQLPPGSAAAITCWLPQARPWCQSIRCRRSSNRRGRSVARGRRRRRLRS